MEDEYEFNFLEGYPRPPLPFVAVPKDICPNWSAASVAVARRVRTPAKVIAVAGAEVLVLPGPVATACVVDGGTAYVVRWKAYKYGNHDARMKRLIASVPPSKWKSHGSLTVGNEPLLLFSASPSPYPWGRWEMPGDYNAGAIVVALPPGRYDVCSVVHVTGERTSVDLVRLALVGTRATVPVAPALDPAAVAASRAAAELEWIDSEGGPFVVMPPRAKKHWRGSDGFDDGDSDFQRAQEAVAAKKATISIGADHALLLHGPESATALAVDDGWLFITGHETRDPGETYTAALSVPAKQFVRVRQPFVVPAGGLELRDSVVRGTRGTALQLAVEAGRYQVSHATLKRPGLLLSLVRLRPTRS